MSYLVLARKWRPQSFQDLVGQEHVSRTLANAIANDRVAHAFLFTGVRGVGKTTTARILAKALECVDGPTGTPCQHCGPCNEILDGRDVDVQEIDGASYNGVEEVRKLQESLPYRPARNRYKIYIVDEVHMLSNAAWNAFLKTLEEPPPHVKFIFATTEVHKVPATILSRCQRYDFKLINTGDIAGHLRRVLDAEGIGFEDAAVGILAREAAGSMRDAMSVLDQVIAWTGGGDAKLTADGVARVLGVAARSVLHRLGEALHDGQPGPCVEIVGELAEQGYAMPNVAKDFLQHLRDLVVVKVCREPAALVGGADEELGDLRALAERADADDLSRLYLGFSRAFDDIARSSHPRAAFEMALVRLARRPPLLPVQDLLERLERLERRLVSAGGPPRGGGRGSAGSAAGGGGQREPSSPERSGRRAAPAARLDAPVAPPAGAVAAHAAPHTDPSPTLESPLGPPDEILVAAPATSAPGAPVEIPSWQPDASAERPARRAPGARLEHSDAARAATPRLRRRETATVEPTAPVAPREPAAPGPASMEIWRAIIDSLAAKRPAVASVYEHGAPLEVRAGRIVLGYEQGSFLVQRATEPGALGLLAELASAHFGEPTTVELETTGRYESIVTLAGLRSEERAKRLEAARRAVAERPLVRAAVRVLGAELREIRFPEPQP